MQTGGVVGGSVVRSRTEVLVLSVAQRHTVVRVWRKLTRASQRR